ncbi:MAG: flippase-like domain-containing protein [Gemmatimonadaceae bacterium]|nr:flippase-like domain-containing protein [Gemmatimonadaceae bacterium]
MKFGWRGVLGIVVSVALLAWTLRDVSMREVADVLRHSSAAMLLVSGAVATLVFPLRALRWRVILEPVAALPLGPLWRSIAIGMMVNNVAPARAGELARAFAITREAPQVRFGTAFGSLAVDRIIDAVVVVVLLVIAMLFSDIPTTTTINGWTVTRVAQVAGGLAITALAGVTAIALFPGLLTRIFDALFARFPGLHGRGRAILDSLIGGFVALRSPGRFVRIVWWAAVMWLVNALAFYIGFLAVGMDVPFWAAIFVASLIAIGVAAPSSPGFVGVFEFFAKAGLALYGVPSGLAVSWALAFHFIAFIPITVFGFYYFGRLGLHFRDLGSAQQQAA